jgi:hypothetical protein
MHPWPSSPCKITLWNTFALPWQDPDSWETTGNHKWWDNNPALVTPESWLVYAHWKVEELSSPSRDGSFPSFPFVKFNQFLSRELLISNWDLCMHTTQAGSVVTRILLFHTYYSCTDTVTGSCAHNHTIYSVCSHGNQHIFFNLNYIPRDQWLEVWRFDGAIWGRGELGTSLTVSRCSTLINQCQCFFDVGVAIGQDSKGCGGLAWETAYASNDKCVCQSGRSCGSMGWHYCTYWSCVLWAT